MTFEGCKNMLMDVLGVARKMTVDENERWDAHMRARPSMHPHCGRKTEAGPIRHEPIGKRGDRIVGRVWTGMRKYGWVYVSAPYGFKRSMDLYANAVQSAIHTAWRC